MIFEELIAQLEEYDPQWVAAAIRILAEHLEKKLGVRP